MIDEHPKPSAATVHFLYNSAYKCAYPTCAELLFRLDEKSGVPVPNSKIAHIHARRRGGPRWKEGMSSEENRSESNLLVLCHKHADEIDALWERYPADLLRLWKREQQAYYARITRMSSLDSIGNKLRIPLTAMVLEQGRLTEAIETVLSHLPDRIEDNFVAEWVTATRDVDAVFKVARKVLPHHGFPTRNDTELRLYRNPQTVLAIRATTGPCAGEIRGFFMVYPLLPIRDADIQAGRITRGGHLKGLEIQRTWDSPSGIYIGAVGAIGEHARTATSVAMQVFLRSFPRANIYGRPATDDGLTLLTRFGFRPLFTADGIWATKGDIRG